MNLWGSQPSQKNRLLRWLGSLIAIGLLVFLFFQQGWEEIFKALRSITWGNFLFSLFLIFLSRFSVTARWYVLLRATDLDVSLRDVFRLTFAGLFGSNFLPTTIGGDLIRLAGAIQLKLDGGIAAASLIVDRLVGMFGMAIMLPFGLIPLVGVMSDGVNEIGKKGIGQALVTSWIGARWKSLKGFMGKLIKSLTIWKKHPKALLLGLVFTCLHMFFLFSAIYVLLRGMHDVIPMWKIGGLWSVVYFITLLPISINGLGLQEISISYVYSNIGGIQIESSLVIAVLIRTLIMLASTPGALFVPSILAGMKHSSGEGKLHERNER